MLAKLPLQSQPFGVLQDRHCWLSTNKGTGSAYIRSLYTSAMQVIRPVASKVRAYVLRMLVIGLSQCSSAAEQLLVTQVMVAATQLIDKALRANDAAAQRSQQSLESLAICCCC
jgi:hypothetical protein